MDSLILYSLVSVKGICSGTSLILREQNKLYIGLCLRKYLYKPFAIGVNFKYSSLNHKKYFLFSLNWFLIVLLKVILYLFSTPFFLSSFLLCLLPRSDITLKSFSPSSVTFH